MRNVIVFPGQKVITTDGRVAIVAFVRNGQVFVFDDRAMPVAAQICGDAYGGEHDQSLGLAA